MLVDQLCKDHVCNFTVPAHTNIDASAVKIAYDDVRSDCTDTKWAVFKYNGNNITVASKGTEFDQFKKEFHDMERCYGYVRCQVLFFPTGVRGIAKVKGQLEAPMASDNDKTGDELSKRTKFILITWIGKSVGVMDRAKIIGDKSLVKEIITNYAAEFQLENSSDLNEGYFAEELTKIGGAAYGTGVSSA